MQTCSEHLSLLGGQNNLHVHERDWGPVGIKHTLSEDFVEVRCGDDLRARGTSIEQSLDDSTEQTGAIWMGVSRRRDEEDLMYL